MIKETFHTSTRQHCAVYGMANHVAISSQTADAAIYEEI
jgi:hypothetical protein